MYIHNYTHICTYEYLYIIHSNCVRQLGLLKETFICPSQLDSWYFALQICDAHTYPHTELTKTFACTRIGFCSIDPGGFAHFLRMPLKETKSTLNSRTECSAHSVQ